MRELFGGKRTSASGKMLGLELVSLWRKRVFDSGEALGLESWICCARTFFGETTASKNFSARDFLERGRARGKRVFASGRVLGLESGICCARSFFGGKTASKKLFSVEFFEGRAG